MGRPPWRFVLASVALLLDPTFADVLVQSGYDQLSQPAKPPAPVPTYVAKSQPIVQPRQTYVSQENPVKQLLQYQHKIQQQNLQSIHQQERDHLLQLQHQQLQHPAVQQAQMVTGNEVVGTPWGIRPLFPSALPAMGGVKGGRIFSLSPFGLNTFTLGGLGGLTPLLLSPYHPQQVTESNQFEKSDEPAAENRPKRDVRDGGESTGRKARQKGIRSQQHSMAENSALNSRRNANPQIIQSNKSTGNIVESTKKSDEETVGTSNLLDPLGIADKAGDMIEDLKHGHLLNPLDILNGGGLNSGPSWLNKANAGSQQFEEHVVSQPNRYQFPNQGQSQRQLSQEPVHGGAWKSSNQPASSSLPTNAWANQPSPSASPSYGMYPMSRATVGQAWSGRTNEMGREGNGIAYQRGQWLASPNSYNQAVNAMNDPLPQRAIAQTTGWKNNGAGPITGSPNPAMSETQPQSNEATRQLAPPDPASGKDAIIGGPNPNQMSTSQVSWGNPNYNQMLGSQNPLNTFSPVGRTSQPIMGTLYNPITGSARPAAWNGAQTVGAPVSVAGGRMARSGMVGNFLADALYDIGSQMTGYNGNYPYGDYNGFDGMPGRHFRPNFDLDDLFDNGYNNYHNHFGGYDRFYGTDYGDVYGDRGGYPYHHQHHRLHIF